MDIIGDPLLTVVAFVSNDSDSRVKTYPLADLLTSRGWHLNILQFPKAIHIACTLLTINGADDLLNDVKECIEMLKNDPLCGNGDVSAIYGTAASVPDRSIIEDVACGFLDALTLV